MQVDFYLLKNDALNASKLFACRLLEKAYNLGHRIFVYAENQKSAYDLDELLWTYKDNSFIPHNLQGEGPEPSPAIQIGYGEEPRGYSDILINLHSEIPAFYKKFARVIEIVENVENAKEISRQHFRDYKKQKCELFIHNID